jgi:hypothetical protein
MADSTGRLPKKSLVRMRNERNENRGDSEPADWGSVDGDAVVALIEIVCRYPDHTVSFGEYNGSYSISIYDFKSKDRTNFYVRPTVDPDQAIWDIVKELEALE